MFLHHWRCYKATRKARCSRHGGLCSCEATNCTSNLGHQCPMEVRNGSKTKPKSTLTIYKNRLEICLVLSRAWRNKKNFFCNLENLSLTRVCMLYFSLETDRLTIFLCISHVTRFFSPVHYVVYTSSLIAYGTLFAYQEVKDSHIGATFNKPSWNKIRSYKFILIILCLLNKVVMLCILSGALSKCPICLLVFIVIYPSKYFVSKKESLHFQDFCHQYLQW